MKQLLVLSVIILMSIHTIYAEDNKWIDGIKIRYGILLNQTQFSLLDHFFVETNNIFSHLENPLMDPIAITLPETLMNTWSFRGFLFEWQSPTEMKDLAPADSISTTTEQLRQKSELRTLLYNNFFNASEQAYADANSNWALSADITSSRVFLGYYWGVFYPAFENQRFLKNGVGLAAFYSEISYKLNLCSQYKVTLKVEGGRVTDNGHGGECLGKTEIDSGSDKVSGLGGAYHITFWERVTKDSIWKIVSTDIGVLLSSDRNVKLKNHDQKMGVRMSSQSLEFISYTYRF